MADAEVIANIPAASVALVAAACKAGLCSGVHYDAETLKQIQQVALEKFLSIPRGGLEVGGLLFGRVTGDVVEILAAENFPIEYLSGPSFILSERDETALTERLQGNVPELDGVPLAIVGWWHSHTRTEANLTPDDIRVHHKFFHGSDRVALIVKPFKFEPAQVMVYRPGSSHAEVACAAFSVGKRLSPEPQPVAAPDAGDSAIVGQARSLPVVIPHRPTRQRNRGRRRQFGAMAGVAALALLLLTLSYSLSRKPVAAPLKDSVNLSLSGAGNELTIRWDGSSSMLASARSAELVIVDGPDAKRIPLNVDSLRNASLAYARRNSKVEVRLRAWLRDNQVIETVAHYVGPATPAVERPAADVEKMKAELERLNGELMRMRKAEPPPPPRTPSPKPVLVAPKVWLRTAAAAPASRAQVKAAQPTFVPPPAIVTTGLAAPPVQMPIQSSPPIEPNAPQVLARAAKPSSGRAIWTGMLPRGGVLLFDGHRPSAGAITGGMPQRRSRVRVYPADLTEAGIVVYTDGSKQKVEPPGAANGWNRTTYRGDAKRSRDVTVVEAPSQSNNWQKLMVRSDQRPVSMLVVEWEEIP